MNLLIQEDIFIIALLFPFLLIFLNRSCPVELGNYSQVSPLSRINVSKPTCKLDVKSVQHSFCSIIFTGFAFSEVKGTGWTTSYFCNTNVLHPCPYSKAPSFTIIQGIFFYHMLHIAAWNVFSCFSSSLSQIENLEFVFAVVLVFSFVFQNKSVSKKNTELCMFMILILFFFYLNVSIA